MSRRIDHEKRARADRAKRPELTYLCLAAAPDAHRRTRMKPKPAKKSAQKSADRTKTNIAKSVNALGRTDKNGKNKGQIRFTCGFCGCTIFGSANFRVHMRTEHRGQRVTAEHLKRINSTSKKPG